MSGALIELSELRKSYGGGEGEPAVEVLQGISLSIRAGEFVAIVGASGSGKSTLMHLLGCLDRPSAGRYRFAGRDVAALGADELAALRREAFGFVFQGYHLIPTLDAAHNVQLPAVHAGVPAPERAARARALLERLGLGNRAGHWPRQLSGGQQQRVSIARALINGGRVILADEPTGALDSQSGAEVMALLRELAAAGHTVILITHDAGVAAQAARVVRLHDGRIVADERTAAAAPLAGEPRFPHPTGQAGGTAQIDLRETLASAWRSLWASRFRTLLTLLGIVIGVASVIVLMAVGLGASERTLANLAAFGSINRVEIWPDEDPLSARRGTLSEADVGTVRAVANVEAVVPFNPRQGTLVAGAHRFTTWVLATGADGEKVFNLKLAAGSYLNAEDERTLAPVVVLGARTRERLFPEPRTRPVGEYIQINGLPFRVIGVLEETGDDEEDHTAMIPFATGALRLWGSPHAGGVQLRVADLGRIDETARAIEQALERARGAKDFRVFNNPARVRAQNAASRQQALLLALIAGISLVVGGIGVMNIMLMSVKERTREIGIRMATGARQRDIQWQFLAEAVVVSLAGGVAGVAIGLLIGAVLAWWAVPVVFTVRSLLLAFGCALATGLLFGFMPARQAARLEPVVALAGE
ncbi:MacB family efflux pump subunit [Thauera linaloolentis]|nr:MacB family efflux pump subunit [Thauera linaloolentis]MCM8564909.1 MacB family efflux pump subunit [Thauera linaloolentis]